MTATLAASTAILKTKYPGGKLPNEAYENNTLLSMLPKREDFDGQNYVVALMTEATQGASASFSEAQANLQQSNFARFTVTRISDYSLARITGEALKAAVKDTGALVDLWDNEMRAASFTATRSLAIQAYRSGTGSRAQLAATSSGVGTPTVTLAIASDVTNFALNMWVQASPTDGAALDNAGAKIQITGIDRQAGTLTAAGNWTATIAAINDGHFLYRSGDGANGGAHVVVEGMQSWIGNSNALFGLTRTPDPVRLGGQTYDSTGVPMAEALIEACARVGIEGGRPSHVFCHPRDLANLKKQLDAKVQYDRVASTVAGISFSALELEGDNAKVKVMSDMNCPRNKAFVLQLDNWKLHSLGAAPQILDFDSNQFLRVYNADAYEVRVGTYGNLWCNGPANQIIVTNFGL